MAATASSFAKTNGHANMKRKRRHRALSSLSLRWASASLSRAISPLAPRSPPRPYPASSVSIPPRPYSASSMSRVPPLSHSRSCVPWWTDWHTPPVRFSSIPSRTLAANRPNQPKQTGCKPTEVFPRGGCGPSASASAVTDERECPKETSKDLQWMIVRRARRPTSCIGGVQWCDLQGPRSPRLLSCAYPSPLLPLADGPGRLWTKDQGNPRFRTPAAGHNR
ncbi:hypothetical protein EDB80DRAFT_678121 [Ilyonectria destructans]|nr:hypothetical protein EDB80DRAFT_678121 [Ilyonectria destructans]